MNQITAQCSCCQALKFFENNSLKKPVCQKIDTKCKVNVVNSNLQQHTECLCGVCWYTVFREYKYHLMNIQDVIKLFVSSYNVCFKTNKKRCRGHGKRMIPSSRWCQLLYANILRIFKHKYLWYRLFEVNMSTFNALSIGVFGSYLSANGAEKGSERQYGKPSPYLNWTECRLCKRRC